MNFPLLENDYFSLSDKQKHEHSNLFPIATIVCNSPGFSPTVEIPPFVHYVGPILEDVNSSIYDISIEKYPNINEIIDWIENDEREIILMSLSTVAHFSSDGMDSIIYGLASLADSYRVLWVVREAARHSLPNDFIIPDNFHLINFIPQYEVLAHEKVKLFFSVGGINSILESIARKKPILCCGSHFEQHFNCKCVEDLGIGIRLDKKYLSKEIVREKALYLLNNQFSSSKNTLDELNRLFFSQNSTIEAANVIEKAVAINSNRFLLPRTVFFSPLEKLLFPIEIIILIFITMSLINCLCCLRIFNLKKQLNSVKATNKKSKTD